MIAQLAAAQGMTSGEVRRSLIGSTPLGRLAVPEDVAAAVLFYASDLSALVTSISLTIDGGATVPSLSCLAESHIGRRGGAGHPVAASPTICVYVSSDILNPPVSFAILTAQHESHRLSYGLKCGEVARKVSASDLDRPGAWLGAVA